MLTERKSDPKNVFEETGSWREGHWYEVVETIYRGRTAWQDVEIYDTAEYGSMLVLDGSVQSAEDDEHIFHECLVHPALTAHPKPRRVLVIGGGEGATIREVLRHPDIERVVMVDIDAELVEICKEHLPEWHQGSFADNRVELVIGDGRHYVETTTEAFDIVVVDVVDAFDGSPAAGLYVEQFYLLVKQRLASAGVLVVQAMELSSFEYGDHCEVVRELRRTFRYARSYSVFIPSFWCEWGYVAASDAIDVAAVAPNAIDAVLKCRGLEASLRFYDGITHRRMFALPKDIRWALGDQGV